MLSRPCFLFIFVGAPCIAWTNTRSRLKGALTGITESVVGVIFNLALRFALNVFFTQMNKQEKGILVLWTPVLETLDWRVGVLAALSAYLMLFRHWDIIKVLGVAAILAVILTRS